MRIRCNACEDADAVVLCCADEAALCAVCDEEVHSANKLAGNHQRVPLLVGCKRVPPKCDICQESSGYFFCVEDRALLCRSCDVSIHTANPHVSVHKRFLLTGVQVGLDSAVPVSAGGGDKHNNLVISASTHKRQQQIDPSHGERTVPSSDKAKADVVFNNRSSSATAARSTDWPVADFSLNTATFPSESSSSRTLAREGAFNLQTGEKKESIFSTHFTKSAEQNFWPLSDGVMPDSFSDWPVEDFLGITGYSNFSFSDQISPKGDSGMLGSSESSLFSHPADERFDSDELFGRVPEIWTVPEHPPSPPTSSGLHFQQRDLPLKYRTSGSVPHVISLCTFSTQSTASRRSKRQRML